MRVMGIEVGYGVGRNPDIVSISILRNNVDNNELIGISTFELTSNLDEIMKIIKSIFEVSKCDYICIDSCGMGVQLYEKLKDEIGEEYIIKAYKQNNVDERSLMIQMLFNDKILSKVGIEPKIKVWNGRLRFDSDAYKDSFELDLISSIGIANKILNER